MKEVPNMSYIKEISGGDVEFENQLIEIVKIELPKEIATYNSYLKEKNLNMAADLVHKVKHKISTLGLEESYQLAILYEIELRQDSLKYKEDFDKVLKSMINFINCS